MSHLDEGTLHALLDGELGSTELMEIEAHLGSCAACGSRLRDARTFLAEADRLVGSVQLGRFNTGAEAVTAASPAALPHPPVIPPASPRRDEPHPWDDVSPVLLIPDNPESAQRRRAWLRAFGVAATIAVAVGAGYMASTLGKGELPGLTPAPRNPALANAESDAVASPAETNRPDPGLRSLAEGDTIISPRPPSRPVAAAPPAKGKPAADKAPVSKEKAAPSREVAAKALTAPKAPAATAPTAPAEAKSAPTDEDTSDAREEAATSAAERDAIRLQATQALNQLDRERRASRAAAATAALDQAALERRANTAAAPAAPAPAPPTLEQRSQVYLRIGLDEASRQLGGPVHVIEGMSPVFMGLAPGRVAAGADTTRPVVRVVYQDSQGRTILLDQQRRSGPGGPPAGGSAWSIGDVTVGLRGEAPAETLRSLRNRVR